MNVREEKEKMKKIIAMLSAIVLTAGILTGCGTTATTEPTNSDVTQNQNTTENAEANEEPITLTIAARGGSHVDVIEAVKGTFEENNNVQIEVLGLEADDLKQKVALDAVNANGAYDLVMIDDPVMPEYAEVGVLLNLTENGYEDDADFVKQSLDIGKNPYALGDTYALPFAGNVQLLFYNQNFLESIEEEVPVTWNGILEIAKKAKQDGVNGYVIRGQQGNPIVSDFLPILWAFGGDVFDENWNVIVDSEEGKEALQLYCDLLAEGVNYEKNDIVSSVADGSSVMALGWPSWFISGTDAQAAYASIPAKISDTSDENATGMIGNWMMGVTANSTQKELAIKLLTYLTSAEVQAEAVQYGGVPTRTSVFTDSGILSQYPYFTTIYEATVNSVVRPRTAEWSNIEVAFGTELSNVISEIKTVDEGLADAKKAIEDIMNK